MSEHVNKTTSVSPNGLKDKVMGRMPKSKEAQKLFSAMDENMTSYMGDPASEKLQEGEMIIRQDCHDIDPNPFQNRRSFDVEGIKELADSIRENGQSQPIVVRSNGDRFQIISGERRWRACQLLEDQKVDVVIRNVPDLEMIYRCYSENSNRKKILDYEQSITVSLLLERGVPVDDILRRLGISLQDYYKINKFQQMHASIQEYLDKKPHALQRNGVADLFKIQKDLGGAFTSEMANTLIALMEEYVQGNIKKREVIVTRFKKEYVKPKSRQRAKVNEERELLCGKVKVGTLVKTPTQMTMTVDKSEMDKETLDKLESLIADFIANQ